MLSSCLLPLLPLPLHTSPLILIFSVQTLILPYNGHLDVGSRPNAFGDGGGWVSGGPRVSPWAETQACSSKRRNRDAFNSLFLPPIWTVWLTWRWHPLIRPQAQGLSCRVARFQARGSNRSRVCMPHAMQRPQLMLVRFRSWIGNSCFVGSLRLKLMLIYFSENLLVVD